MSPTSITLHRLSSADVPVLRKLKSDAFADAGTYGGDPPSDAYLEGLLAKDHVMAVVAIAAEEVLGGLVAYELDKFESARRELYIYDLAVSERHRRQGVATALIEHLLALQTRGLGRLRSGRPRRRPGHRALRETRRSRGGPAL